MSVYYVKDQTGLPRSFRISGSTPSPTEQVRIDKILSGAKAPSAPAPAEPGIMSSFGSGLARGWNEAQAGIDFLGQKAAEQGIGGYTPDAWDKARQEQLAERDTYYAGPDGDFTSMSSYDKLRSLAGTVGGTAPPVGITLGLAATGVGAPAAAAFGAVSMAPQMLSQNVESQEQEKGKGNVDMRKLAVATAGQTAIEFFSDRVLLGLGGVGKKAVPSMLRKAIADGTEKGFAAAAAKVGTAAAAGALTGATEEASQQLLQRWQADQSLSSPEAMSEYIQNAVVGGILEGAVGGAAGGFDANEEAKYRRSTKDAQDDAASEHNKLSQRDITTTPKPIAAKPDPEFLRLEDHSNPSAEQLALQKEPVAETRNRFGLVRRANDNLGHTEEQYTTAMNMFRDDPSVARDKIKNQMKIGRQTANSIFEEMLRRNDAMPTGPEGKWLRITVPKGMATREKSDISGNLSIGTEREYAVAPVDNATRSPYTIHMGDRQIGDQFQTHEAAQKWAVSQGIRKFEIKKDTAGQQFGLYQKHYKVDDNGERVLVGNKVLSTFATPEEANAAAAKIDPAFSTKTNDLLAAQQDEDAKRSGEIKSQIDKPLQDFVNHVLGVGRAKVDVQERIDPSYLRKQGVPTSQASAAKGLVVEGVTLPKTERMPQVISAAKALVDPNNQAAELKEIVGGHELFHSIINAGLLAKHEVQKLMDFAARTKVPNTTYTFAQKEAARHPGKPFSPEEMVAEMFRHYVRDPLAFDKSSRPLLQRLKDFILKFLRLARDDGSDILRSIYGGKIADRPENYGDSGRIRQAFFSSIRVDPFYSKATQFFETSKQEKASAEQWMATVRKAGIKEDELNWLGLEDWFKKFDGPIPREEIVNFVKSNGLQVLEEINVESHDNWNDEDQGNYDQAFEAWDAQVANLTDRYSYDVNQSYYMQESNRVGEPWLQLMAKAYAADGDPDAQYVLDLKAQLDMLADKKEHNQRPRWSGYTQEGGTDYATAAFYLPMTDLNPMWDGNSHYDIPNVIASARFKTRIIEGKKALFLEEVQSDLHQAISRYGHDSPYARKRGTELEEQILKVKEDYKDLVGAKQNWAQMKRDSLAMSNDPHSSAEDKARHWENIDQAVEKMDSLEKRIEVLRNKKSDLADMATAMKARRFIPDAPLKSSWEEFVIKRMIRYAAENDFDYLAWHGEGESVADTEQYNDYQAVEREAVDPEDFGKRVGNAMAIRKAFEKASEAEDSNAMWQIGSAIGVMERQGNLSPTSIKANITPQVMDKYFPAKGAGVDHMSPDKSEGPMNAIFERYLTKLPRIAKQIGKKYGSIPQLYDPEARAPDESTDEFDQHFKQHFDNLNDLGSLLANYGSGMPPEMAKSLGRLQQYLYQNNMKENISPEDLFKAQKAVGVDNQLLDSMMGQLNSSEGVDPNDWSGAPPGSRVGLDQYGNVAYKKWMLPLTDELRRAALEQGFPIFSAVNAKNDPGFAEGTKLNTASLPFDGQVEEPIMPTHFSSVPTNYQFTASVEREIKKSGYTPLLKQRLAKAKIYDKGMTPYGMPLERGKPAYVDEYVLRMRPDGNKTPVFGALLNPNTGKKEPSVIRAGGDWIPEERGITWPSGYGFNHSVWHHESIAKDLGISNDRKEMLMLFAKTMANGGDLEMDKDNRAILTVQRPDWRRPLKLVIGRSMVQDEYFPTKTPVWNFITAFTSYADPNYSSIDVQKPLYAATAPMGQRVPPAPPQDVLRQFEQGIVYDNLVPAISKMFRLTPKGKGQERVKGAVIQLQDRMLSAGALIDMVRKNGGIVNNDADTYMREQLMIGQIDAKLQDNHKKFYTPLNHAVARLNPTETQKREASRLNDASKEFMLRYIDKRLAIAEMYLYAQHAQERNAVMRERNVNVVADRPEQYQSGSGMSDFQAQQILDWVNRQSFAGELSNENNPTSVRSLFRKLISSTNDVRVEGNLNPDFRTMTDTDGNPVDTYKDYAPVKGWLEEHVDDDEDAKEFARAGKGLKIMGKEDRSALGRSSLGVDLIGHAVLQNQEAVYRAGKNETTLSFVNLLRENPLLTKDAAEIIGSRPMKYALDRRSGRVRKVVDNSAMYDDTVLVGKVGGNEIHVKIKDPRLAKALNQRSMLGNNGVGGLTKGLLLINRFLAATRTSYNPEFMLTNFGRDLQTAGVNISEVEMKGLRRSIIKNLPAALLGIREGIRKDTAASPWGKVWASFKKRGGPTAYLGTRELSDTIKRMHTELSQDVSGNNLMKSWKAIKSIGRFVEDYNSVIENGVRVSTFKALRDRFVTDENDPANVKAGEERAAHLAKRLTVNFNMGGELKPYMNAWYLFFNASLQGSVAMIDPLIRSPRVRKIWGSVILAGVLQDALMSMISPEDDDGVKQYDKIPAYILEHNLVFMDPFGLSERGYFKIPLPYLMSAIHNAGRVVSAGVRGQMSPGEAFGSLAGTLADSLNPWSGSNSFLNFVAPTILDPFVDLARNEDFTGRPIAPEASPYGGDEKASQRYWNNTSPIYTTLADWMSRLTGSEGKYLPGVIEASPNQVGYVVEFLTGSAGAFARRVADVATSPLSSEGVLSGDISANDIPVARALYGNVTSRNDLEYYVKNRDLVLAIKHEITQARKDGEPEHAKEIIQAYPDEVKIMGRINALEQSRKKIAHQINLFRANKKMDEAAKKRNIDRLQKRQQEIIGRANGILRTL